MGERGTFAAGNPVPYTYKTVDRINGIKILEGIGNQHGLPKSSHSSFAYVKLKPDGTFHEMRFYNKAHELYLEIAYHPEPSLIMVTANPLYCITTYMIIVSAEMRLNHLLVRRLTG